MWTWYGTCIYLCWINFVWVWVWVKSTATRLQFQNDYQKQQRGSLWAFGDGNHGLWVQLQKATITEIVSMSCHKVTLR